jgi:hypothetical protein
MKKTLLVLVLFPLMAMAAEQSVPDKYAPDLTNHYLTEERQKVRDVRLVLPTLPRYQQDFITNYVKVKRHKDDVLLKELIHPASRACENEENLDYFDYLREFYLTEELPDIFAMSLMPIDEKKRWPLKQRLGFPVEPTHVLFIEYGEKEIEGLQRYLRKETYPKKRMYEVVKCPDRQTLKEFREQMFNDN